jgi:hypothetical protein
VITHQLSCTSPPRTSFIEYGVYSSAISCYFIPINSRLSGVTGLFLLLLFFMLMFLIIFIGQVLYTVAKLGIAEMLKDGPKSGTYSFSSLYASLCFASFLFGFSSLCFSSLCLSSLASLCSSSLCLPFLSSCWMQFSPQSLALSLPSRFFCLKVHIGEEIAKLSKANTEYMYRFMRTAASLGILQRDPNSLKYSLNDMSTLLLGNDPEGSESEREQRAEAREKKRESRSERESRRITKQ